MAARMLKPTRIVISCDPNSTEEDQRGMENVEFALRRHASNGSHVALSQHVLSF